MDALGRIEVKIYFTEDGRNIFFSVPKVMNKARIYSNPVSEYVKFANLSSGIMYTYEIYSNIGNQILSGPLKGDGMIDLQHLSDGNYILILQDDQGKEALRDALYCT